MKPVVLVADDERDIVSMVSEYLMTEGYEVWEAENGTDALELALKDPDLILLDVMMPGLDGFSICREIREAVQCPILFLSARVEEADRILGLSLGGDDYILKPFSIGELGARIQAHLRRERRRAAPPKRSKYGNIWIDYASREAGYGDTAIGLARKEYEILELLTLNPGLTFSRERMYERIWGYDAEGDAQAVTEHIKRLRAKLADSGEEQRIETVWGVGYRWRK
ncbi:transcriptional regulator [Paenibacillus durus]|uniref:Transcriptional regulator n=2 Tax=Paenibacillus durus TaxID=44251 RepID=A0A089HHV7_PAEDU|nr:transcriptional regulator [Paenibacillus durus]